MGKELYEIETDLAGYVAPNNNKNDSSKLSPSPAPPQATILPSQPHHSARVPLIKFIGKRALQKKRDDGPVPSHKPATISTSNAITSPSKLSRPQTGVDFYTLRDGAFHGRAKLSQKESEAIESGGATIV